ncbi:MAG: hypothetical protein ACOYL3_27260 [Desulfuromonadaceae bacterium]
MLTTKLLITAFMAALLTIWGCSVNRALNSPQELDIERVKVGESRQTIISVLGEPKSSEVKQDGRVERYEFVTGYSKRRKVEKSFLYIGADVYSLGVTEYFFNKHEKNTGSGTTGRAIVDYGMNDLAKSVLLTNTDGEPWENDSNTLDEQPPGQMLDKLPPPKLEPPRVMPSDGRIALVVQGDVKPEFEIPESSVFSAAGKGASTGAIIGAGAGVYCYWGAFLCIPAFGTAGGIIGSFVGPTVSEPSSTWASAKEAYVSSITGSDAKGKFARDMVRFAGQHGYNVFLPADETRYEKMEASRYRELAKAGVSGILEIDSVSVILEPVNRNPLEIKTLRRITPRAHVRLVGTTNYNVLYESDILDNSGTARTIEEWLADDASLLRREITVALPRLARFVVAEIFELQPIETRKLSIKIGVYDLVINGLKPIYPKFKPDFSRNLPEASPVPTLRWEAFPGKNVTYDLRIWHAAPYESPLNISSGELVCEKEDLLESFYTVEVPLEGFRPYLWSVRAHFDVDGIRRVTQWSRMSLKFSMALKIMSYGTLALTPDPMSDKYYMFKTGFGN